MTEPMRTSGVDARTEAITRSRSTARGLDVAVLAVAAAIVIGSLAVYRLRTYPYHLDLHAAMRGAATTVADTAPAAARTWTTVGVIVAALAGWLRRRAPDLARSEAVAAVSRYVTRMVQPPEAPPVDLSDATTLWDRRASTEFERSDVFPA